MEWTVQRIFFRYDYSLDCIFKKWQCIKVWKIYRTDEFKDWFDSLEEISITAIVTDLLILEKYGPSLGRPYVDTLKGSKISNLKELRTRSKNGVFRILFVLDPERDIILLLGGDKSNDKKFYQKMIKKAEKLYQEHLIDLGRIKNED